MNNITSKSSLDCFSRSSINPEGFIILSSGSYMKQINYDNIISQLKGALIHVTSDNVIIQNNNFKNCEKGWGIHLDGSDNNIIRNNVFYNVKSGVYFSNSDTSDLVNNSIENCIDAAIYLKNSKNNRIYDSFLRSSSYGLYATDSNNINITNNTIIGNDLHGIGLFLGSNDIIRMNKVVQNNGNG